MNLTGNPLVRLLCLSALICWTPGCGGGSTPPAPAPAAPPPPRPVAVVPAPQPAPAAPAVQPQTAPRPGQPPADAGNRFPQENPDNVFVAGSVGTEMTANPQPAYQPSEYFVVAYGQPGVTSSQFQVAAATGAGTGAARPDLKLPAGFEPVPAYGYSNDGYPLRIRGTTDQKLMAFVPGGTVRVGSPAGPAEVQPEFVTFLDPFYMDVTEVTVDEFERFRQAQREAEKRVPKVPLNSSSPPVHPVLGITWGDASVYARWAGKELPTEAQFEKAARGSEGFQHPWGNGRPIWTAAREPSTISGVAKFAGDMSPYGIYDLAGNAREWSLDWYSPKAHQEAAQIASRQTLVNWGGPKKSAQGNQRVIKGGGPDWKVWNRQGAGMGESLPNVGFRCVLPIPSPTPSTAAG